MPDELEERLKSHAQAFDSLLSLIPAKLYYGEDVSDQWQRKKQTPEQKRAAKMAKLDPDNWKSAKDVMDERQAAIRKRKRQEDGDLSDSSVVEPEGSKASQDLDNPKSKKRRIADTSKQPSSSKEVVQETEEDRIQRKKDAKAAKKERKKEKKIKAKEKLDRQKVRKKEAKQQQQQQSANGDSKDTKSKKSKSKETPNSKGKETMSSEDEDADEDMADAIDVDETHAFSKGDELSDDESSSKASDHVADEVFSPVHDSGLSSSSSIPPPQNETPSTTPAPTISKPPPQPATKSNEKSSQSALKARSDPTTTEDPRQRLQAAISAFRAERKADDGPKSRAELLEQRRRQEERRRAEKKEQKRREKEEAARKQEEEVAKRFSPGGSGSLLGSPRSPIIDTDTNNFSFGRVAFGDGSSLDADAQKKKGPSDPATAFKAAQAKKQRISSLDAEKQATIRDKDMWANARKRAGGEKVKDDTSLLKRALKRHEGQKKKSEKEWNERKEGVQKSIDMKQKKRTDNLAQRKDEKHNKGKKGKVKRPGFEGSFKGRTGGGKKP